MGAWIVLGLIVIAILMVLLYRRPPKKFMLAANYKELLTDHVAFYRAIGDLDKARFEEKIKEFLGYVTVTGVNTEVEELDRLLVASSAIIPIFGFPEWKYYNLREVLLYPEAFNRDSFLSAHKERNTLGMVGNGPLQRVMILSKPSLREGFKNRAGPDNTGIHEFVHLLDKEDGAIDGVPRALLQRQYTLPWLNLISENIQAILEGRSDINVYGATNKAEFFAVASEYFFERPDLFKERHGDLYSLMTKIFHQEPPAPELESNEGFMGAPLQ